METTAVDLALNDGSVPVASKKFFGKRQEYDIHLIDCLNEMYRDENVCVRGIAQFMIIMPANTYWVVFYMSDGSVFNYTGERTPSSKPIFDHISYANTDMISDTIIEWTINEISSQYLSISQLSAIIANRAQLVIASNKKQIEKLELELIVLKTEKSSDGWVAIDVANGDATVKHLQAELIESRDEFARLNREYQKITNERDNLVNVNATECTTHVAELKDLSRLRDVEQNRANDEVRAAAAIALERDNLRKQLTELCVENAESSKTVVRQAKVIEDNKALIAMNNQKLEDVENLLHEVMQNTLSTKQDSVEIGSLQGTIAALQTKLDESHRERASIIEQNVQLTTTLNTTETQLCAIKQEAAASKEEADTMRQKLVQLKQMFKDLVVLTKTEVA